MANNEKTVPRDTEDVEHLECLCIVGERIKWLSQFGEKVWQLLIKLNTYIPCDWQVHLQAFTKET